MNITPILPKITQVVGEDAFEKFTEGDCFALATVIHQKTSWPIVILSNIPEEKYMLKTWSLNHVVVEPVEGIYLDICGLNHKQDVLAHWQEVIGDDMVAFTLDVDDPWAHWAEYWGEDNPDIESAALAAFMLLESIDLKGFSKNGKPSYSYA